MNNETTRDRIIGIVGKYVSGIDVPCIDELEDLFESELADRGKQPKSVVMPGPDELINTLETIRKMSVKQLRDPNPDKINRKKITLEESLESFSRAVKEWVSRNPEIAKSANNIDSIITELNEQNAALRRLSEGTKLSREQWKSFDKRAEEMWTEPHNKSPLNCDELRKELESISLALNGKTRNKPSVNPPKQMPGSDYVAQTVDIGTNKDLDLGLKLSVLIWMCVPPFATSIAVFLHAIKELVN